MWQESHDLLSRLGEAELEGWELALPTSALAEVLAGLPLKIQSPAYEELQKIFHLLVFDAEAARIAGRVARSSVGQRSTGLARQRVKVDVEIVATAARHECAGLCFFDGDHDKISRRLGGRMRVGPPASFLPKQVILREEVPRE
jgi:predicted nucleic acid-binding protein